MVKCYVCNNIFTKGDLVVSVTKPIRLSSADGDYSLEDFYSKEKLCHLECFENYWGNSIRSEPCQNGQFENLVAELYDTLTLLGEKTSQLNVEKFIKKIGLKPIESLVEQWLLER